MVTPCLQLPPHTAHGVTFRLLFPRAGCSRRRVIGRAGRRLLRKSPFFGAARGLMPKIVHDNVSQVMILPQVHLRKHCYDFYFL